MSIIKLEGNSYSFPDSWEEVNIKQYIQLQKIIKEESGIKQLIMIISSLSGCPIEKLYEVSINDFQKVDFSWLNKKVEPSINKIIEIDGVRYGVIKDMKNLSLAEYVDLDSYIANINENIHKMCAILMRPIIQEDGDLYLIEKYNHETVEMRANIFYEKMNVVQLISLSDFFLNSANGFLKNSVSYLAEKTQKKKKK